MREFAVHLEVRKGFGPDTFRKTIFIGIDDIDPEISEYEIREMVITDANVQMRRTEDFKLYGHNWTIVEIEEV